MANHRCFSMQIIDSDAFLDMPLSTQALYFHLSMRADDEGFVNNPKKIQRTVGASEDDLKILLAKSFLIAFESGVVVIKHWKIHNYIRGDRLQATTYTEEKAMLSVKDNKSYTLAEPCQTECGQMSVTCQTECGQMSAQVKLSKDKLSKDKLNNRGAYFEDETLNEAFLSFIEMRKKLKSPMTDRAIDLAISKLTKMASHNGTFNVAEAIEIVNQSILNGWKGFYELKKQGKANQFGQFEQSHEDLDDLAKKIFAN